VDNEEDVIPGGLTFSEWVLDLEEEERHGLEGHSRPPGPMECWRLLQESRAQDERRWNELHTRIGKVEATVADIENKMTRMSQQQAEISTRCTLLHVKVNRLIADKPITETASTLRPINHGDWHEGSRPCAKEGHKELDAYRRRADRFASCVVIEPRDPASSAREEPPSRPFGTPLVSTRLNGKMNVASSKSLVERNVL